MNRSTGRLFYVILSGMILTVLIICSVPVASASQGARPTIAPGMPSEEPPPTNTPTATAIPVTGLVFTGWYKGCTSTPYITCSATVNSTQTDPYRWDFDITYTYGDNRTNMGSTFTLNLAFDTGVFYTDVPIWWEIYPITNEVMPNRWIDVAYSGVPDLNPMSYPSGSWTIPSQPSPYDSFWIRFSRVTEKAETLVRTDSWHVTVATYDYHALTPTPTPTATLTSTPTLTPTETQTPAPTVTPTPNNQGSGTCWRSGLSWSNYTVYYDIDSSVPQSWIPSIEASADTWNNVIPSHFTFVRQIGSSNTVRYQVPNNPDNLAVSAPPPSNGFISFEYIKINPNYPWDINNSSPSSSAFNVQNAVTHEFGHWLMLIDITDSNCTHVTMYESTYLGDIGKITLDIADENAINWQYP